MTFDDLKRLAHDAGYTRTEAASLLGLSERAMKAEIRRLDPYRQIAWPGELVSNTPRQIAGFATPKE